MVKNIPWSVTWQQLKDAFREFGTIVRSDIPQDSKVSIIRLVKYKKKESSKNFIGIVI